jgi:hypothetical protein
MALFNLLGDGISFGSGTRKIENALASSKYASSTFRYPIDLGSADKGHYILININEQINTSYRGNLTGDDPTVFANRAQLASVYGGYDTAASLATASRAASAAVQFAGPIINPVSNFVSSAGNLIDKVTGSTVAAQTGDVINQTIGIIRDAATQVDENIGIRTIRRISDTVALYMPDNLKFNYTQGYSSLSPGTSGIQTALSVLNSASDTYRASGNKIDNSAMAKNLGPFLLNYLTQKVGGDVGKILFTAGSGGKVQNPMLELLYSSPDFRTFTFDFAMFPRSEKEALEVHNIIDLLRFHQAPELVANSGGAFLYPPSEFDISFYYNGGINHNIPKISTCVLESIQTDYAPGGFAAYEVEGELKSDTGLPGGGKGRTGMPVAIRLSLSFRETEYLVKGSPMLDNKTMTGRDSRTLTELNFAKSLGGFNPP